MDSWMLDRKTLENDLLGLFSALGDLQYQYDWIISDHDIWYAESCPDAVKERWQWTGLLMDGAELTEHLQKDYVTFCVGGVLSAVPLGTKLEQVWNYTPVWEVNSEAPDYQFQTPLTQLELMCYDGYAWLIVCTPEFSERVRQALPQAQTPDDFFSDL